MRTKPRTAESTRTTSPNGQEQRAIEPRRKLVITPAIDVEEDVVDFLVPKRVPRGELTLIAGMPGDGKTLWWIEVVACLTRGDFGDTPAKVLITSTEDSIRTTIKPRLRAANAVLENVSFISVKIKEDDVGQIRFPDDINQLALAVEQGDFRLLVIDPLLGHINTRLISAFKDEQLREYMMTPLARIAQANDCAVIGVMHFNKRTEGLALQRVAGSQGGITGPARSVLFVHRSPDSEQQRILTHVKSNYGKEAASLVYEMEERTLEIKGRNVAHAHLLFVCESDYSADDLLTGRAEAPEKVREAIDFFRIELANGARSSKELRSAAKELGISDYAWTSAKKKLQIVPRKLDFDAGWELMLPAALMVQIRRTNNAISNSSHSSTDGKQHSSSNSRKSAKSATRTIREPRTRRSRR